MQECAFIYGKQMNQKLFILIRILFLEQIDDIYVLANKMIHLCTLYTVQIDVSLNCMTYRSYRIAIRYEFVSVNCMSRI